MRVLIVKLTSMGDLIHALPAIHDASEAIPDIEFDWVIDEAFVEIASLHKNVKNIIPSAHRRWSKSKWQAITNGEIFKFCRNLRARQYDIVLDAQNNTKSAIITRLSRGLRCGMDKKSVREYGAHLAYQKKFTLPPFKEMHAIQRQRLLFAKALGYDVPSSAPYFAIDIGHLPSLHFSLPDKYLLFIHSTTWESKLWPERYWTDLIQMATQAGFTVVLPWGSPKEHQRAIRLSQTSETNTFVVPYLNIMQNASLIQHATGVITVDTGLAHLTAALQKPGVHLYGPTDFHLLGITNPQQIFLSADYACAPCYLKKCKWGKESECFVTQLPPQKVWDAFLSVLFVAKME